MIRFVTEPGLASGSDRVWAALSLRDPERRFRFVVNLQGDLPTVDAPPGEARP